MPDEREFSTIVRDARNKLDELLTGKRDPATLLHPMATRELILEYLNKAKKDIELAISQAQPRLPAKE
jgi:hypothetical protein